MNLVHFDKSIILIKIIKINQFPNYLIGTLLENTLSLTHL